ncbi:MAG: cysteine desulfurase family protein [Gaiellales bacterium]
MLSVYLDCAATTPLCPEAREAMEPYLAERFGNASEPHGHGRDARLALESSRRTIAAAFGCEPGQVIFTSGGTEADNQAVFGFAGRPLGRMVVSAIEHSAVRAPALELARQGFDVAWAPVTCDGVVDTAAFGELVRRDDRLAAVMWANNVTGAVQPVQHLAALAHERGVPFHADAVQAAASLPISFSESGVDSMAISAHKMHGPKGVGCLIARDPSLLPPLIWGGGQEGGRRSGTENIAGVVGFAAAVGARDGPTDRRRELRDRLEAAAGLPVVSAGAERLPGHSLLLVEGLRADLVVLALDQAGYAVSAGSACASGEAEPSHVLLAQGLTPEQARSVIRVSFGADSTTAEIDGFVDALRRAIDRLRAGALIQVPARSPE